MKKTIYRGDPAHRSEEIHKPITDWEFEVERWAKFIMDEFKLYSIDEDTEVLVRELTNFRNAVIRSHDQTLRNKGLLTNEVSENE